MGHMALIRRLEPPEDTSEGFDYKKWYQKNKEKLSEKRAKKYAEDPAYREKALERSRKQRKPKPVVDTGGYTVSMIEASRQVGVTIWTLREWRRRGYFPEPRKLDGKLWFTQQQVNLLMKLREESGREEAVDLVYANW